jgi:hypothetical protein
MGRGTLRWLAGLGLLLPGLARVTLDIDTINREDFDNAAFAKRIVEEGTLVGTHMENTSCPGVQNKVDSYEYFVTELEGDEGERNIFDLVTLVDIILNVDKMVNRLEPWIFADILIR